MSKDYPHGKSPEMMRVAQKRKDRATREWYESVQRRAPVIFVAVVSDGHRMLAEQRRREEIAHHRMAGGSRWKV